MSYLRHALFLFVLVGLFNLAAGRATSSPGFQKDPRPATSAFVLGEILIKFTTDAQPIDKASARAELNALRAWTFRSGAEHWRLGPGLGVEGAIQRMKANPLVEYVEPNYVMHAVGIPNDPQFNQMWHLLNTGQTGGTPDADIDADGAWDIATGGSSVVVGVIDTGVAYNHPDLAANIWTNPNEIAGNGIDDDVNGYVDDVRGYDFVNNDGDPNDDHSHGTHVAGIIGAVGNNGIGVVGVNWQVKIMALKFLDSAGFGTTANAVRAIDYSVMMGVALTNNSWGGGEDSSTLSSSISNANSQNMAFVAAAGNTALNIDSTPFYPASYTHANIISVAATTNTDVKWDFSNYGATSVDLGAPGVNIFSTVLAGSYDLKTGTSMAAPQVAGVAALMLANAPGLSVSELKSRILNTVDPLPSLAGITVTGGRLNALFALSGSLAESENTLFGSKTLDYKATFTANDVRERLVEGIHFVKPDHYYSQLRHDWRFLNVPAASSHKLHVEGYRPENGYGADFSFAYSTDGIIFYQIPGATINSNVETPGGVDYPFGPSGLSGTIYIRVRDTNPQSEWTGEFADVYIDHLTIKIVP